MFKLSQFVTKVLLSHFMIRNGILIAPYYMTCPLCKYHWIWWKPSEWLLSIYSVWFCVSAFICKQLNSSCGSVSEIIMLKHNSYFHVCGLDLYIFNHTSSQPLRGILWCGVMVRGALTSAQYYCTVQYIFQKVKERDQHNLGIKFERCSAPNWGMWKLSSDVVA